MFLKPLMLTGLGTAVIPLALHLLSKARYRTVEWGAMMFLDPGALRVRQSTRLKQGTLLLVRMSMVAFLAIALARPVLRAGAASGSEDARIHAIIILDRSASMGITENGRSRLAAAKQAVVNVLSNLHRGDEVSLILTGDPVDPGQAQPTTDLQSVAARVGALAPSYGRANIAAAMEQARTALAREPGVTHELYLVCDRQANSWESLNDKFAAAWQAAQQQLASPVRFFVIPVGGDESDNIAVESVRLRGPAIIRDIPTQVEVAVKNFGAVPRSNLPVTILSNRKPITQLSINVAPNSSTIAKAWLQFPTSGSQVLTARVSAAGMSADDQLDRAIDVLDPARVLIITGEARSAEKRSSADLVRMALSPYESAGQKTVDPASVRIIGVDDWWGISPDRDDIVILTNIGQLSDDQIRQLEQFIYGGGALIFAPGNLTDVESCNNDLYRESEGFLPASVKSPSPDAPREKLGQIEANHPIFEFLRDRTEPLPDTSMTRLLDVDDRASDARIIASLADGKPFMIERPYGRGRVLMFTATLGMERSALPTSNIYLPLLQSAVRYLAGANLPDRNLRPGEPIELTLDHQPSEMNATIALPGGAQRRVPLTQSGQRWSLRFGETIHPGRYVLAIPGSNPTSYVVAAPSDESDPTPLSQERWAWLQNALQFKWLDGEKDALSATVASQRTGKELHLAMLACVMLLAFGEMALTRMWSKNE